MNAWAKTLGSRFVENSENELWIKEDCICIFLDGPRYEHDDLHRDSVGNGKNAGAQPRAKTQRPELPFSATKISLEICMLLRGIFTDPALGHHVAEQPIFMAGHYRA